MRSLYAIPTSQWSKSVKRRFGIYLTVGIVLFGFLALLSVFTPRTAQSACSGIQVSYVDGHTPSCFNTTASSIALNGVSRIENNSVQTNAEWLTTSSMESVILVPGKSTAFSPMQAGQLTMEMVPSQATT
jgi:hypothetical protein